MRKSKNARVTAAFLAASALLFASCAEQAAAPAPVSAAEEVSSTLPSASEPADSSSMASVQLLSSVPAAPAPFEPVLAESARAADSYFDDAVFIGDSVTLKLKNYVAQQRQAVPGFFGKAQFLAAGSMGSGNALAAVDSKSIHPLVKGKKLSLPDGVNTLGGKKVYIMLGINDIVVYGIDGAVENMAKLLTQIKEKNPDAVFYVQNATPMLKEKQKQTLNNENLMKYNAALLERCGKEDWYYLDIASIMKDENGNLKPDYCSDPNAVGLHFTDTACQIWLDYLYTHTAQS